MNYKVGNRQVQVNVYEVNDERDDIFEKEDIIPIIEILSDTTLLDICNNGLYFWGLYEVENDLWDMRSGRKLIVVGFDLV